MVDGRDIYVAAGGDGWKLSVDGSRSLETEAFGWARAFTVDTDGGTAEATLGYSTPSSLRLQVLAQLLAWIVAIGATLRLVSIDREGA